MNSEYYNAKPSKISNIGQDVAGAKRMNYDTYETEEQKEVKRQKRAVNKRLKIVKAQLKEELAKEQPCYSYLLDYLKALFRASYNFDCDHEDADKQIATRRAEAIENGTGKEFNKMIRAYNKLRKDVRYLNSENYRKYHIKDLKKRYKARNGFIEKNGQYFDWKSFESVSNVETSRAYLAANSKACLLYTSPSPRDS